MRTADFDYALPPDLIAQVPAARRDESRLLVLDRRAGAGDPLHHLTFRDFPALVAPGDLVVVNDSRVIPARLIARRSGGGTAEVLLVTREPAGTWRAMVRPGARVKPGARLALGGDDSVEVLEHLDGGERRVRLAGPGDDEGVLARRGHVPLPPYINRPDTPEDRERYQTVYARAPGSVAAPTAGLHFTPEVLAELGSRGAKLAHVTLHVGPGTFRPVSVEDPAAHRMDAEWYEVPEQTAESITAARERGHKIWAVGTTVCRTLESCVGDDGRVRAARGWTSLFIRPGHEFRVVDHLLTNFHLPRSTLLMLVCAFAGRDAVLRAYRTAVEMRYRFYSYGDAMVVI
ncbi:MAG TPA: tRNA preQ1(34) S-adenosylmethionine ribosyltransferase-isomerase QueA [Gemmatimonadales bacterium]|nr:tRNA preQ1(34) S-adenosylmethionine ribosyltransferase-isomerase QueA [Gemmatimonadales bacterium]